MSASAPATAMAHWPASAAARRRLIVFPHAGAGALAGRAFQTPDTDVLVHRRPGRESRMGDPTPVGVPQAAAEAHAALLPLLAADTVPTAVLGHSFGALSAAEFTAAVDRSLPGRIERLVISAKDAPPSPDPELAAIVEDDDALADWLLTLGGTPAELLEDAELRQMVLAPLRADLRASLSHAAPAPRVAADLLLVHAQDDRTASPAGMAGWSGATSGTVQTLTIPGGHHGLLDHPHLLHDALWGGRGAADEIGSEVPGGRT